MKMHTFPVTCDVCGGDGMGTIQTAGAAWNAHSTIVHNDPRICRSNLERERRRIEKPQVDFTAQTFPG